MAEAVVKTEQRPLEALRELRLRMTSDTSEQQGRHVAEPHGPPPRDQGEREAPTEPPEEWREAAGEAERRRP